MNINDIFGWRPSGRPTTTEYIFRDRPVQANGLVFSQISNYLDNELPKIVSDKLDNDLQDILHEHYDKVEEKIKEQIDYELERISNDENIRQKLLEKNNDDWKYFAIAGATLVGLTFAISTWK